jgi:hypothetical protein
MAASALLVLFAVVSSMVGQIPLTGLTALSSSVDEVRRALEDGLHRPILEETGLTDIYDFEIQGEARNTEEFFGTLRDQLGLVLTPTRRSIEIAAVRLVE